MSVGAHDNCTAGHNPHTDTRGSQIVWGGLVAGGLSEPRLHRGGHLVPLGVHVGPGHLGEDGLDGGRHHGLIRTGYPGGS